uniref:Guanine nucleotide-binding protein subunit beta-like protein n=1 Tax=Percolomonas cosmopolitus TaxID=63605 RepID=A0A7S1KNV9_9EUKA|mmetsp:Transcript_3206/g.12249  ORF Transcript_3206/g.12249 Transcript_3206/m.12249 type:complete len:348 (+) Transcript_3206:1015-2058(+)
MSSSPRSKQFFTHEFSYPIYALSWSNRKDEPFRLATCSFVENNQNEIQILKLRDSEQGEQDQDTHDENYSVPDGPDFNVTHTISHEYPATKLMFMPDLSTNREDLLISSGDGLSIWNVPKDSAELEQRSHLSTKHDSLSAPLTSFDWCSADLSQVGTASIDTMVTIWDIAVEKSKARLIAHDKEVYDIAFQDQFVFGTVGADGSARMFDLRDLQISTIVHETNAPLLKISWNQQSPNFFATFEMDSPKVTIMDIRNMESPYLVCELDNGHSAPVNAIQWAPHSWCHLSSAGDDSQVLIWDLHKIPKPVEEPILSYSAESSVQQLQWSTLHPDWIAIASEKQLQLLRV